MKEMGSTTANYVYNKNHVVANNTLDSISRDLAG